MKIFCLEDEVDQSPRNAIKPILIGHDVTYAKSCDEGKKVYQGPYDLMLLDHDMRGLLNDYDHPNGHDFVKWLVEQIREETARIGYGKLPYTVLHSHSWQGRKNMRLLLEEYGFEVVEHPFNLQYVEKLKSVLKVLCN